jgi:hypothetical protein
MQAFLSHDLAMLVLSAPDSAGLKRAYCQGLASHQAQHGCEESK